MRAIVQRELGPPDVLRIEEWPPPEPQAGQLLIDVEVANITFIETQLRAGRAPNPAMLRALPTIPGNGIGGVVSAVGAEVDPALVGTRVVASTGGTGAYARQAVAEAEAAVAVPAELTAAAARQVTILRGTGLTATESAALTRAALELAATGQLRPVIGQTFSLERAADAHAAMEARTALGKTLLLVG